MKHKETQSKILSQIKDGKLYNKKMVLTIEHLFKENHSKISRNKIKETVSKLNKQGKILIKDNKIVPLDNFLIGVFETKRFGGRVVVQQDGERKEYTVVSSDFKKIPHNTVVGIIVDSSEERNLAHIASIISFNENSLYGNVKLNKRGEFSFVPDFNPFNAKFTLEKNNFTALAVGKKTKVKIVSSTSAKDKFTVVIENEKDIFGPSLSPMANIEAVLREEGVPSEFPVDVLKQVALLPDSVSQEETKGRKDYRNMNFITIDPETAKDMDDAVYVEKVKKENGAFEYKYYVAIADISHYVPEGSPLDKEAQNRAFSIYAAGGVVPMFPTELSNNICSVVEGQDRLAVVSEITFDEDGNMVDYSFFNGVINSKHKLSYENAQDILDGKLSLSEDKKYIHSTLNVMQELTDKISSLNKEKGAVSLSGYQPTIILNEDKNKVEDFVNKNRIGSTKLIEKAMVANNVAIAKFLKELDIPFISREHESPHPRKFDDFVNYMSLLGFDIDYLTPTSKSYADVSELIEGHYLEKVMGSRLVRSMQKAKYSIDPQSSHFALAEDDYTHFTAGIRRYIDITVHRTIKKVIELYDQAAEKGLIDKNLPMNKNAQTFVNIYRNQLSNIVNKEQLAELAFHINQREERANKVESKTAAICAALYMQNNIGRTYSAYVSSVEKDHIIATLKDENDPTHSDIIDVILPLKDLIKSKKIFVNPKTGSVNEHQTSKVVYNDGMKLNIKISDIDLVEGKIMAKDEYIQSFENLKNKQQQQTNHQRKKPSQSYNQ